MVNEIYDELTKRIIPFWENLYDDVNGGFYGYVDYDLKVKKDAPKGGILSSRVLWFFSNAYVLLKDEKLLKEAAHAYDFLINSCLDKEKGGVFWMVDYEGKPLDTMKHTYNQAFAIYALSSYYEASGKEEALSFAVKLFNLIEENCYDGCGYLEALDRDFNEISNEALSENGVMAQKTMNTLLHICEAYTELYRVAGDRKVKKALFKIYRIFHEHIFNRELGRQEVFFDRKYNSILDLYSYGHDIETAWLLKRSLDITDSAEWLKKLAPICITMAENVYREAFDGHSLANECDRGVKNEHRIWWGQAESVVGFLNAYEETGDVKFLEASKRVWDFIKTYVNDGRKGGEWYWEVNKDGVPFADRPIVEPWKCPYHNGRMCMEVIKRMGKKKIN